MAPLPEVDHRWSVRVQRAGDGHARAYARGQAFDVDSQASLRETDPHPSAVEYAIGALGGDLACGLQREAAARALDIHAIEVSLSGRLDNVLVHFGVVGEQGHPGLAAIEGIVYVGTEAPEAEVEAAWRATLARSPLFHTLTRCAEVRMSLRVMP